ncbi:MAG: SIMPL domain-containing protein [Candidatus Binatia bacterium]
MDFGRWLRPALASCLFVFVTAPAASAADPNATSRSITVVGLGRERGTPDIAQLQFAVEQTAPSARAASQAAAKASTSVIEALRSEVGSAGKVETAGFSLNPVYRPASEQAPRHERRPEIVGYTAVNEITVQTRRIDGVGALIDAAITAGAARIGNLSFTIENPAAIQARALQAAGADAAAQAAAIAEALHVHLTGVLEATTDAMARPLPQPYGRLAMQAEAAMAQTPIEPGEVTTEARLRVTYGIE